MIYLPTYIYLKNQPSGVFVVEIAEVGLRPAPPKSQLNCDIVVTSGTAGGRVRRIAKGW